MPWAVPTSLILVLCAVILPQSIKSASNGWIFYFFFFRIWNRARCLEEFSTKYFHVAQDRMCLLWLCTIPPLLPPSVLIPLWHYSICFAPISSLFLPLYTSVIGAVILTIKQARTHAECEQRSTALELDMEKKEPTVCTWHTHTHRCGLCLLCTSESAQRGEKKVQ